MADRDALTESYDDAYDRTGPLFGLRPDPALSQLIDEHSLRGRALDIGAGDGRHSVLLARHGLTVEAIDVSESGIAHIRQLARRAHLDITARVADVREPDAIGDTYDLIVADTVLGHFERDEATELGRRIADALTPGGRLFVSALADDDPRESEFADLSWTYYAPDELIALFPGLRVERCEKLDTVDRSHGTPHRHRVLRLIAYREDRD
jgi:2-polyprenyl-3-methyl-5-hydroxy-6-metoxy-1,4-benzoquinol methylase